MITDASDVALNGASVIDFDSQIAGTNFASDTIDGVTFSANSGSLSYQLFTSGGTYGTSGGELSTTNLDSPSAFEITFDDVVSAFGMIWGAADPTWTVTAFDIYGDAIETVDFVGGGSGATYVEYYGIAADGIKSVSLATTGYDWVKIDDLAYVSSAIPVPLPAALPILATALGALGVVRSRRRRQD